MSAAPRVYPVDSDAPDLLLNEFRERMAIVDMATTEVARMCDLFDATSMTRRRMIDLNDPKVPLAMRETMQQEGINRRTPAAGSFGCPACRERGNLFHGAHVDSAAQLLMHLLECPSYDHHVSARLGDARPF